MPEATVNTPSSDYDAMEAERKLPRALVGGTETMRKGGSTWTPLLKDELEADQTKRLDHYFLVDFYDASVSDLVDRMFSQGVVLSEDVPQQVVDLWGNLDGQGRSGDKFFYDVALEAARYGYCAVQADHPSLPVGEDGEPVSLTAAQESDRRPYLTLRRSKSVIGVDPTDDDGPPKIERARIRETVTERDGYSEDHIEQVRELIRGVDGMPSSFQLWRQNPERRDEWERYGGLQANQPPNGAAASVEEHFQEVFLVPFYMGFERFHYACPPFRRGADLCLQHWRKKGDIDFIEHLANTPSLVLKSAQELSIQTIGSRKVVRIPVEASLDWLVIDPKGIEASKASLEHLEEHIRLVFRAPMVRRATGKDLVGVRQLDETRPMTRAQMWALGIAQSITQCLNMLAWWMGLESDGTASFPEDALQRLVDPDGFERVLKLLALNAISKETAQREAVRYNVLDEDHDVEADLVRLDDSGTSSAGLDTGEQA